MFFIIVLVFLTYKNYGITWDEVYYVQVGRHYTIEILNALKIKHNLSPNNFVPTQIHLRSHGVFFDVFVIDPSEFCIFVVQLDIP